MGEPLKYTETTQADFEQGILDGVAATSVGDLELKKYDGLKFDGSTNYINTSNFTTPNAFTITAEIKLTQYPSDTNVGCIINNSYNSGIGYIFYVASDGRIGLRGHDPNHVPTSYDVKSNYVITLNQPTRIDITYDGATTKIFVNKVLDYQTPSWFTAQRTAFVTGKAAWASSNYFKGEMYAVSVWSRALTQAEITDEQELLGNEAGLVLHYALDEIGGRDVYDSTANSYNGYAYGTNVYWITVYEPSGNRVSPAIDLSATGIASDSAISWAETLNAQPIVVESNLALDGVNYAGWQTCTNGGAVPGITSGTDLSVAKLQLRETLTTTDPAVTPQLHDLALSITIDGNADGDSGQIVYTAAPVDGDSKQTIFILAAVDADDTDDVRADTKQVIFVPSATNGDTRVDGYHVLSSVADTCVRAWAWLEKKLTGTVWSKTDTPKTVWTKHTTPSADWREKGR